MTVYIGVDFHPHQQTVAWCDKRTGETGTLKLAHNIEKVREFYSSIEGPALIGVDLHPYQHSYGVWLAICDSSATGILIQFYDHRADKESKDINLLDHDRT